MLCLYLRGKLIEFCSYEISCTISRRYQILIVLNDEVIYYFIFVFTIY